MNSNNQSIQEYWRNEQAKYWPVHAELMLQYKDGSHNYEDSDGDLFWYQNDLRHRDGDKPAWIWSDGHLEWYKNGKMHRDAVAPLSDVSI